MGVQLLTASCGTQGLEYTLSFFWKPPILIAWKPRADLDRDAMDPARDTVVSSLYKVRLVATVLCALHLLAAVGWFASRMRLGSVWQVKG